MIGYDNMLKFIYEYFVSTYTIFDDPLVNYLLVAVVASLAYFIAYIFVGYLYATNSIEGRGAGKIVHWITRLGVFLVISTAFYFLINFVL